jgi:hypothetical protein
MRKILIASTFILTFCILAFGQNSVCPTISITGPPFAAQPGETVTFTANFSGDNLTKIEYKWSVDKGTIIEGQGTPVITVSTEGLEDRTITTTVEIKGLPEGCPNTDSETATDCSGPDPILFDESGLASLWTNSTKLNELISELENNSNDTAYFIIYPHEKESPDELKIKQDYIRNYLIANNIKPDRLIFVSAGYDENESDNSVIRIWRIPVGAEPPTP